jgi:hypothetical protein
MEANGKLFGQYTKPAIGLPFFGCTFEIAMHARAGTVSHRRASRYSESRRNSLLF